MDTFLLFHGILSMITTLTGLNLLLEKNDEKIAAQLLRSKAMCEFWTELDGNTATFESDLILWNKFKSFAPEKECGSSIALSDMIKDVIRGQCLIFTGDEDIMEKMVELISSVSKKEELINAQEKAELYGTFIKSLTEDSSTIDRNSLKFRLAFNMAREKNLRGMKVGCTKFNSTGKNSPKLEQLFPSSILNVLDEQKVILRNAMSKSFLFVGNNLDGKTELMTWKDNLINKGQAIFSFEVLDEFKPNQVSFVHKLATGSKIYLCPSAGNRVIAEEAPCSENGGGNWVISVLEDGYVKLTDQFGRSLMPVEDSQNDSSNGKRGGVELRSESSSNALEMYWNMYKA